DAATNLVQFDGLEQGLEVAVAEAFIALALDDLEEDRAEQVFGEDLQQQTFFADIAVQQDAVLLQALEVFTVAGDALVHQLVIGLDRVLQLDATGAQFFYGAVDVLRGHGEVLDAFAIVLADELFDLRILVLALVQRDADGLVRRDHRLREQAGGLALDVEILLLFKAEDLVVEGRPGPHLATLHVVGQVVENLEANGVFSFGLLPACDL